ncbi:hypothetical protein G7Y89_g12173 [Cudoniella acicularis]|uniref:Uncharacterized protein n=1 Tax=Cudoniella acicularis TaxID=354080 RepID=A0A8H4VX73_9HELO|nr:hypothetical protein G7Y89_g12173 [Cudoniella acicularis]
MVKISLLSVALAISTFLTITTAVSTAPPFRLIVNPTGYTGSTLYLLANGNTTTDFYSAAECWVSPTSQLFCGDFNNAVGIPSGQNSSVLAACIASGSTTCTTGGWNIVQNSTPTISLTWPGYAFSYDTGSQTAYAVVSGSNAPDTAAVPATLVCGF